MPTRADVEAATPKCACGLALEWRRWDGMWCCREHGKVVAGAELVVKQHTTSVHAA